MPDATNNHDMSGNLEKLVDEKVSKAFEARQKEFRSRAKAFIAGLTIFIVFLVGFGFLTKKQVVVLLIDAVYPFEERLSNALAQEVAVSYNNVFWLGTAEELDKTQSISFYCSSSQDVKLQLLVQHIGSGEPVMIRIWLDESRDATIWEGVNELRYAEFNITEDVRSNVHQMERPENVHELHFELVDQSGESSDKIIIKSLINVIGRESDTA